MTLSGDDAVHLLTITLNRSAELEVLVRAAWETSILRDDPRARVVVGLCAVSLDHSAAAREVLLTFPASAIALVRPQYESLVRAVWAAHAASDGELARLLAPLSPESQQAAKKLPGVPQMLEALDHAGPPGAAALLARARSRLGDGLNSFIHGGIHPFARQRDGYPVELLLDVTKNTNALSMLTLILLETLTDDIDLVRTLARLHQAFVDVLPTLERY
jgi:hypothetical protein